MAEAGDKIPREIEHYLALLTDREKSPAWVAVAKDGVIREFGGHLALYGFSGLAAGQHYSERMIHLDGFLPVADEPMILPSMQFDAAVYIDVHLIPGDAADWVLLINSTDIVRQRQMIQQKANELALFRTKTSKMLAEQGGDRGAEGNERLNLVTEGERRDVAILFANLRGFTRFSEENDPKLVFRTLNSHLRLIVKLITEEAGFVDNILGDTVTATFGILPSSDLPERHAVQAAVRIVREFEDVARGSAEGLGIGVASGAVSYGVLNTAERRAFSAIGHRVNMAARLESQAGSGEILIDDVTYSRLTEERQASFKPLTLQFRGTEAPIPAYSLSGIEGKTTDWGQVSWEAGSGKPSRALMDRIQMLVAERLNPAYVVTDVDGKVEAFGGDLSVFGLDGLKPGEDLSERATFLMGLVPAPDAMDIPAMMTDSGNYADVQLAPVGDKTIVLFFDVTEAIQQKQVIQQRGNDLSLLSRQLERRNRFIKETFGRYLSDEIVDNILDTPAGLNLSGETRKVTILMNDLRGFTSMCERLLPDQVVLMLNNFLGTMTEIILKYQGTIDEFIGDAILVIFGAPVQRDDDAARAVACATEMMLAMTRVNDFNESHGLPKVEMGIGLNTGDVIVGNIGSERRLKYGVVGSNVNLTARVESYTVGGQVLASERTVIDAGDGVKVNGYMEVSPKGVAKPMTIYDIGGIAAPYEVFLPEIVDTVKTLKQSIPVEYQTLDGKQASGPAVPGLFNAMSNRGATLQGVSLAVQTNLKLAVFDHDGARIPGDLYAKVVPSPEGVSETYLRFTSLPPVLDQYLQKAVAQAFANA